MEKETIILRIHERAKKENKSFELVAAEWIDKLQIELYPHHEPGCSAAHGDCYRCRCGLRERIEDDDYDLGYLRKK